MRLNQPEQGENLFLSFQNQDPAAFRQIFDLYNKSLYYTAFRIVQDQEDAEDIVQDAFKKLWEHRTTFTGLDHLIGFLFTVSRNAAINQAKKKTKQKLTHTDLATLPIYDENAMDVEIHQAWLLGEIYRRVEELPEERRKVFQLHFYGRMTIPEIAAQLGRSEQTVRNQKIDAIKQLREVLPESALLILYLMLSLTNQ